jgi:hypothetical protein
MPNLILDLMVDRVDLVDEGANSEAFIKLYKRKENEPAMKFEDILKSLKPEHVAVVETELAKAKGEIPEETVLELAKAKTDLDTAQTELARVTKEQEVAKSKDSEPDFEEVLKSLDPSVQEVFKSLKAQKDAAEQVARDAADKAATEEAVSKAKELKSLPVEEARLVEVMKGITPEIHEILKAANQAIEDGGLFDEVGKSKDKAKTTNDGSADQAWTEIEKKAGEIKTRDSITFEAAISKAIMENPELYKEYLKGGAN